MEEIMDKTIKFEVTEQEAEMLRFACNCACKHFQGLYNKYGS